MKPTREKILESLQTIVASSEFVKINSLEVEKLANELSKETIPPWDNDLQLLSTPEEMLQYYFFVDSINCCFWAPKGKERWTYEVNGEWISGYYAFSAAIKDAFLRDKRFFDSLYLAEIPEVDFRAVFERGKNELLLIKERWNIIRENFSILQAKFQGNVMNLLEQANRDVDVFIPNLLENFPTFRDQVYYKNSTAYFLKRAQLLPSDLSFALPNFSLTQFKNIENLTVFADYKLPQILEAFRVLKYTPELQEDIIQERFIPAGSQKEIEIRANTIVAIEQIAENIRRKGGSFSARQVDWMLWVKAKQTTLPRPYHKTVTTFY